jgi:Spy/CpxP family protein refolding chaperone
MKKVVLLAVAFVCALSGLGMARDPGPPGEPPGVPPGKWWKLPDIAERLALTEEEKGKLDTMYLEQRQRMIDLRSQAEKERLELEQLLDSTTFDPAAALERFKRLQEAHKNLGTERFQFLLQVRSLLGHDRFQLLKAEVWKYRMKRMQGQRHPGKAAMRGK